MRRTGTRRRVATHYHSQSRRLNLGLYLRYTTPTILEEYSEPHGWRFEMSLFFLRQNKVHDIKIEGNSDIEFIKFIVISPLLKVTRSNQHPSN